MLTHNVQVVRSSKGGNQPSTFLLLILDDVNIIFVYAINEVYHFINLVSPQHSTRGQTLYGTRNAHAFVADEIFVQWRHFQQFIQQGQKSMP